jgi:hypothetical protein
MSLSGVEVIVSVHKSMLSDLSARIKNWKFHTRLGEAFLQIVKKHYFLYIILICEQKNRKQLLYETSY